MPASEPVDARRKAAAGGPSDSAESKRKAARETIDILHEISTLLNTQLDRQSLSYCVSLIENGVNPKALATVIQELRAQNALHEAERERAQR